MTKKKTANSQRIGHLILLYITTCGLYFFYWFYKANKELYGHKGINKRPAWRTLGLLVPILNIYLLWTLFKGLHDGEKEADIRPMKYPGWLTVVFLLLTALYRLPGLYCFLGFASVLPIAYAQKTLNRYWKKVQPDLPEKTQLSLVEILICIVGSILLALAIIGAGLPPAQE